MRNNLVFKFFEFEKLISKVLWVDVELLFPEFYIAAAANTVDRNYEYNTMYMNLYLRTLKAKEVLF